MEGQLKVALPRDRSSASRARYLVAELSAATLDSAELDRAKLLVSELVTNALVHGRGVITLRASLDAERLLVEVTDEGSGFEGASQPNCDELGGLGLGVVDAEASRWGVHEGTTQVWFEIDLTSFPCPTKAKEPSTDTAVRCR
jgi:anti-sigma regulatory factor (Ser/Thr protein kinase)